MKPKRGNAAIKAAMKNVERAILTRVRGAMRKGDVWRPGLMVDSWCNAVQRLMFAGGLRYSARRHGFYIPTTRQP